MVEFIIGWVDKETYKTLRRFTEFKGKDENGGYRYEINPDKMRKEGLSIEDVTSILSGLGVSLSERDVKEIENKLIDVEIKPVKGNKVAIKPNKIFIKEFNDPEVRKALELRYDWGEKEFHTYPFFVSKVIDLLKKNGYKVKAKLPKFNNINLEFKGELRDYQKEALESWKKANYNGIISLPTGAGKTVIGVAGLAEVKKPTLILSYTKEQMMQWKKALLDFTNLDENKIGLYYSDKKEIKDVTVATYQTAYKHMDELGDKFDLSIFDEAHHVPAELLRRTVLENFSQKRLGLTATPFREDDKSDDLYKLLGEIVYQKSAEELAAKNYLADLDIEVIYIELTPEEAEQYEKLMTTFKYNAGDRSIKQLLEDAKKGDETAKEALSAFNNAKKLAITSKSKLPALRKILEKEKGNKILVFTQYIDQAEEIGKMFNVNVLTSKTSKKEREQYLEQFKQAKEGTLVLTTVGDEGLDIPSANVGIIAGGTGSMRQYRQRIGRILRPKPGQNKAKAYEIVTKGTIEEPLSNKRRLGMTKSKR